MESKEPASLGQKCEELNWAVEEGSGPTDEVAAELLQQIANVGIHLLRARYGVWALLKDDGTSVEIVTASGKSSLPEHPGFIASKIRESTAVLLREPRPIQGSGETQAESFLAVPLLSGKEILGSLFIAGKEGRDGFGSPCIRLAEFFARIAAEFLQGHKTTAEIRRCIGLLRECADEDTATCITDTARTIIFWSRGAERLYGYTEREALGQSIVRLLVPPEEHPLREKGYPPGVCNSILCGNAARFETERLRKNGQRVHVAVTISPVRHQAVGILVCNCFSRFEPMANQAENDPAG